MRIIPVILCGGSGTRLWPESRNDCPKQFLKLVDNHSLLENTINRSLRVSAARAEDIVCVCLANQTQQVKETLKSINPEMGSHILSEPSARNTAAAVALAALYCKKQFGEESVMWVLPSDHFVGNEPALSQALEKALIAANAGNMTTFGIAPTRPETGYGYIKYTSAEHIDSPSPIEKFVEKPDIENAIKFLQTGNYLWNSGMFLFRTQSVLMEFETHSKDILDAVKHAVDKGSEHSPDPDAYGKVAKLPFDKAIMEKTKHASVMPCDIAWSDVGTWQSIWEISPKSDDQNVTTGHVITADTSNCLIRSNAGRLVAVAGLDNIVVIDTKDAVLVTCKDSSEPLKKIITKMEKTS